MSRVLNYYARRLLWSLHYYRGSHDVTIETANGLLSCSNKDWLIGKHLFIHRNYEFEFIQTSLGFLRSAGLLNEGTNNTVVDIGANLGMISLSLLNQNAFDQAIAFEPSPQNFRLLNKNAKQNKFEDKIRCYPFALSSVDQDLRLEIDQANSGDCRVRKTEEKGELGEDSRRTVSVPAKRFDTFLTEYRIDAEEIDLLWIDVQGHEGHFFKGAEQFFGSRPVPVVTEFWGYGIGRSGMSPDEYIQIVEKLFSSFYLFTDGRFEQKPVSEIGELFEKFAKPREIASIILI